MTCSLLNLRNSRHTAKRDTLARSVATQENETWVDLQFSIGAFRSWPSSALARIAFCSLAWIRLFCRLNLTCCLTCCLTHCLTCCFDCSLVEFLLLASAVVWDDWTQLPKGRFTRYDFDACDKITTVLTWDLHLSHTKTNMQKSAPGFTERKF